MSLIDDLLQSVRARAEHGEPQAASPINIALELLRGTAYEGDVAFLGDLAAAIKDGDLTKFLSSHNLSKDEYAAITKIIDVMTSAPDESRQDRLKREAAGTTIDSGSADLLKKQVEDAGGSASGIWTTQKEYRSQREAYNDLVKFTKEANGGELPDGFPTFEGWVALQGGLKPGVIKKGEQLFVSGTETYVIHPGETWRTIADKKGVDLAELMKINGATDPDESPDGALINVPAPTAATSIRGGRGEQTMPQSNPDVVNPDDPNNPGSTDTPGGGGLKPGELEKGDPWLNSLYEDSFGTDKLGRLIDELITNENYTPGTSSRYERLLRKNAGLLEFGLQMDPASADTGMGTAIAGLMDQIRGGQGIDAWSLINQAAGGDPEYKASFEGDGFDPSNVASILALARSGMVPDEALRSLYQGDYITGLYNDWERANQGQGDVGTFLAYLMSKGL